MQTKSFPPTTFLLNFCRIVVLDKIPLCPYFVWCHCSADQKCIQVSFDKYFIEVVFVELCIWFLCDKRDIWRRVNKSFSSKPIFLCLNVCIILFAMSFNCGPLSLCQWCDFVCNNHWILLISTVPSYLTRWILATLGV